MAYQDTYHSIASDLFTRKETEGSCKIIQLCIEEWKHNAIKLKYFLPMPNKLWEVRQQPNYFNAQNLKYCPEILKY